MKRIQVCFVVLWAMLCAYDASAQESSTEQENEISAGIRIQKAMGFYWTGGFSAELCSKKILKKQLTLGTNFTSSVIGSGIRKNAIKTYEFDLSLIKYFRKDKMCMPVTRLNIGYMYASYGDDFSELPHQSLLCSAEFAAAFNLHKRLVSVAGFGYNIITGNGRKGLATVFPLYGQVSFLYKL